MLCGHARAEACLARSLQASVFGPADSAHAVIGDGSIQSAERLTHSNRSKIGGITSIYSLGDKGHKRQLHLNLEDATVKCSKGAFQPMELEDLPILLMDLSGSRAHNSSAGSPCPAPDLLFRSRGRAEPLQRRWAGRRAQPLGMPQLPPAGAATNGCRIALAAGVHRSAMYCCN